MALERDKEMSRLLREERLEEFNRRAASAPPDLENADLRMVDLRRADLRKANLRGAYLRDVDLRGVDLSDAELDGASIHGAKISGAWFPRNLPAEEITLSFVHGTRVRVRPD